MNKKTIVHLPEGIAQGIVIASFWKPYFSKYFNLEVYDPTKTYNKQDYVFWTSTIDKDKEWYKPYAADGYKIVDDHLWDFFDSTQVTENTLILKTYNFIFINESIWYKWLGYQDLVFDRNPDKFFLCLMRLPRPNRQQLFEKIKKYDDDSLISYVSENKFIPGDQPADSGNFQRYVNPMWYNSTNFSLVSETSISDSVFISEKIFKPFAFNHPFIVWGAPNILNCVKKLGFETFSHAIDESYDAIKGDKYNDPYAHYTRLNKICDLLDDLYKEYKQGKMLFSDPRSKEIIAHNHNLFYSDTLVDSLMEKEILNPLTEFIYG